MLKSVASSISQVFSGSIFGSASNSGRLSNRSVKKDVAPVSLEDQIANYHCLKEKYGTAITGLQNTRSWRIGQKFLLQRKVIRRTDRLNKAATGLINSFKKLGNTEISFSNDSKKTFAKEDTAYLLKKLSTKKDEDDDNSPPKTVEEIAKSAWDSMRKNLDTGKFETDPTQGTIFYNNKSEETEVRSYPENTKAVTEDNLDNAKTIIGTDLYMQVAIASLMNQNFCFPVNDIEQQNYTPDNSNKKNTQADLSAVALLSKLPRPTDLENNFTLELKKESSSEKFTLLATSVIEQEYTLENGEKFVYQRTINLTKTIQKNPAFKEGQAITEQNSPVLIECTSGSVNYNITSAPETASV